MAIVIHRDKTFTYNGRQYDVTYGGPGWGYQVTDVEAERIIGDYATYAELRESVPSDVAAFRRVACGVCGTTCAWADDAWVCRNQSCGAEWYPDHGEAYAPPGGRFE